MPTTYSKKLIEAINKASGQEKPIWFGQHPSTLSQETKNIVAKF